MTDSEIHPDSKQAVAERLLLLRTTKGYTQAFAAKLIGVKQTTWAYWESTRNQRMPTRQQLLEIETKMGATREWVQSGIASRMPHDLLVKLAAVADEMADG
jgi:transcriptional regulator with XRE-family HTH domain